MNKKTTILVHCAIWAILFLSPLTFLRHEEEMTYGKYLMMTASPLVLMLVFYANYLWLVPKYYLAEERRVYYWMSNVLMIAVLAAALHYWMAYVHMIYAPPRRPAHELSELGTLWFILRNAFNLTVAAAIATTIQLATRWHHSEEARLEAEAARTEAELRNLRSQINPHFLLNTLNNIYALTAFDQKRAQNAIQQLSKMLRHMLYDNQEETVPLADEIQFLENYVNLMKIRLPQSVDVQFLPCKRPEVERTKRVQTPDVRIAPLIFVSLVENAFKHGVSPTEPSFVHIEIRTEIERSGDHDIQDVVVCRIENSNHPKSQLDRSGHGIGLSQVQRRLDLTYPHRYKWTKGPSADGTVYRSEISIKL